MTTIIDVQDVTKRFGNVLAVDRCSLKVEKGSITGLIGPNGAGKTTMFNMVAGAFAPSSGRILLEGEDVTGLPVTLLIDDEGCMIAHMNGPAEWASPDAKAMIAAVR